MKRIRFAGAMLAAVSLVAAGCSSDDDSNVSAGGDTTAAETTAEAADTTAAAETEETTGDTVEVTQGQDITVAVVTHGDGGIFWSVAQKGAEQAGEDLGITVLYQGANNDAATQSQMIEQAIADEVDGVAVSLADPAGLTAAVEAVGEAGIPLVTLNSGSDQYKELGAITHVGQDETIAGNGAGEKFSEAGATNVLCVMQEQSNVGLQARCDGADETFDGTFSTITTSGDSDPTTSQQEIKAALEADESIDAIFATGPVGAVLANAAAQELGRDVTIGAVDLSPDLLEAIGADEIAFTIDQQQYLQGYLAVVFLYLNITNSNSVGGGLPVYTGPGFVDASNIEAVAALVDAGTR
jgi:simple sugar transport system substrate-binding protein